MAQRAAWTNQGVLIAPLAFAGIALHLALRYQSGFAPPATKLPLLAVLALGGAPLVVRLLWRGLHGQFGSDYLAGVSGRAGEVQRLAESVAIGQIHAETSPEEKVEIVRRETGQAKTMFIGDGINDAPALMAATVGIAFGQHSDVTSEAARVVIIDSSLSKVDELIYLSHRLRRVAPQSAIGGMLLSGRGMVCAAFGLLTPVAGAVAQELVDLVAVLNALRTARLPAHLTDFR